MSTTLMINSSQQFSVSGLTNGGVTWFVNGIPGGNSAVGAVSATGFYTAPSIPPASGTVTVSACNAVSATICSASLVQVNNPLPRLRAVSPSSVVAGAGDVSLTVTGDDFAGQSEVTVNGMSIGGVFVDSHQFEAIIPASFFTMPGVLEVAVTTPAPGGGTTTTQAITVEMAGVVSATNHPQVARYSFTASRDASVMIEFGTDTSYGLRTWTRPTPPGGGQVDILVAGMRAFTTYHMRATVQFAHGLLHTDIDHTFTTGGLPPNQIPDISVTIPSGMTPTPGVQLLDLVGGAPKVRAVVTDLQGNIIWYYDGLQGFPFPIKLLPNGNFLYVDQLPFGGGVALSEIDLAGNKVREVTASAVNDALFAKGMARVADVFHHDFAVLPNGHLVVVTQLTKVFTDLIGFEGQAIPVSGDGLVELDENWDPVWSWSTFDHLDVNRHPMEFPTRAGFYDWTHGNAVVYSPGDGNLVVSLRHQHWVLKIDYRDGLGTGDVLWRLGSEGDFTLTNGGLADWQYGQHFPFFLDSQPVRYRLALFDNGNNRPVASDGTVCDLSIAESCFSRAVIFEIDEDLRTAQVAWEDKLNFFARFIGSIQVFPNSKVLYDAGTVNGSPNAVMREVTQDVNPQTVWQMDVAGQFVYRGTRLPSLYPGVQW